MQWEVVAIGFGIGIVGVLFLRRKPARQAAPAIAAGPAPAVGLILGVAKANQGRITASDVLSATPLKLDEVTKTLDELTLAGTCQLVVGQKGTQVYYFSEFE